MKTVLVIDDEEDLCSLLKIVLGKEKYKVDCVHSLAEAELELKNHPDIVLLDNNLPDGSGLDYFHLYSKKFKKSYVVFVTADSAGDIHERADLAGVSAFIRKPFSVRVLSDTIRKLF